MIENLASASKECSFCWLVLPFREWNLYSALSENIFFYILLTDFDRTKLFSFHNVSVGFILKISQILALILLQNISL